MDQCRERAMIIYEGWSKLSWCTRKCEICGRRLLIDRKASKEKLDELLKPKELDNEHETKNNLYNSLRQNNFNNS